MSDEIDRHANAFAFAEISDNESFMSSSVGDKVFPDIVVNARVGDLSQVRPFKGKVDTGARLCLLAEHVVKDRFGMDQVDQSKSLRLNDLGNKGVETLGRIRLTLRLGSNKKWLSVPFEVIPDDYVRYRYDALLSDKLIKRKSILVLGPDYQDSAQDDGNIIEIL